MGDTAREHLDRSRILDVAIDERVAHGTALLVRHAGGETAARTSWLGGPFHQLRADDPIASRRGDRLALVAAADGRPLGEATVLDPAAPRHGTGNDLLIRLRRLLDVVKGTDPTATSEETHRKVGRKRVAGGTDPEASEEVAVRVAARLREAGVDAPADDELAPEERAALGFLREAGRIVRLGPDGHVHARVLADVEQQVRDTIGAEGSVTVDGLARCLGTTDERARLLLELLDAERVTIPIGDARILRPRRN